ncbi:MAG: chemotaxis protein CheA [Syntrophobacteraceae bacterium]|nr:chemotaxis protein CheA [Desulfobacteraceae bacterium]
MKDNYREVFKEEAAELLSELESSLLDLEENPEDAETIGRVFRALHTIKGSGAMFGFDDIAAFTHEVETVFDLVRNGQRAVTKELVDLTLSARDVIRSMLEDPEDGDGTTRSLAEGIIAGLKEGDHPSGPHAAEKPEAAQGEVVTYRIGIRPHRGIFKTGTNPLLLLNELRSLGECRVVALLDGIPELEALDPEDCYTDFNVVLTTDAGVNAIRDVFIFSEDDCDLAIEAVADSDGPCPEKKLGEILVERGDVSREELTRVLTEQKRIGELLVDAGVVDAARVESALAEQQQIRQLKRRKEDEEAATSIRVPAERLDTLVDLVGELVTVQARLSQTVASMCHPELISIAEEVERLTGELRDNTMSIRMLPIGTTFKKFKRLVRDLSAELGKEVVLITEGAETELDKTVIERLNDPLVHLIRNSIDHGIEEPGARESCGKPRQGTVRLSASHSGANVLICITDDGAGLDADAIRAKAIEQNLISQDSELTEKEIFSLIFTAGFSTSREVTSISGRGVGMDVVRRSIEALRGSIEVNSQKGAGATITLKLPLTLAIIDGLLVEVGAGRYVLPLSTVEECVELGREEVSNSNGRHVTYLRGEIVPYVPLRDTFAITGTPPEIEQIVITEVFGSKVGFVVDRVIGQYQTVIKNLGRVYRGVKEISGATILGDGTVALILDISQILNGVELNESMTIH